MLILKIEMIHLMLICKAWLITALASIYVQRSVDENQ